MAWGAGAGVSEEDVPAVVHPAWGIRTREGVESVHMEVSLHGKPESDQDPRAFAQQRKWHQKRKIHYIMIKYGTALRIMGAISYCQMRKPKYGNSETRINLWNCRCQSELTVFNR